MKKRVLAFLCTVIAAAGLLAGCGSGSKEASIENAFYEESAAYDGDGLNDYSYEEELASSGTGYSSESDVADIVAPVGRKIIYTAFLNIETKDFDGSQVSMKKLVALNGGYIESSDVHGRADEYYHSGNYVIRIPVAKYNDFIESCGTIGSIYSKSEDADDVTSEYVDVNARIKSLQTKLARLEELEQKAENLTDLLEIEDRINETQYQLENYQGQLKSLNDKIDYCTVNINLESVEDYTPVEEASFLSKISDAFIEGIEVFVNAIQEIILIIIFLLPLIVVATIVVVIVLKVRKKKKAKKAKKAAAEAVTESEKQD